MDVRLGIFGSHCQSRQVAIGKTSLNSLGESSLCIEWSGHSFPGLVSVLKMSLARFEPVQDPSGYKANTLRASLFEVDQEQRLC